MTKQNTFYEITFWDRCDFPVETHKFETEAAALDFAKNAAGDPKFSKYEGWSLTEGRKGRFIIENGEDLFPLR